MLDRRAMDVIVALAYSPPSTEPSPALDRRVRNIANAVAEGAWFVVADSYEVQTAFTLEKAAWLALQWPGACTLVDVARVCELADAQGHLVGHH